MQVDHDKYDVDVASHLTKQNRKQILTKTQTLWINRDIDKE